MVDPRWTTSFLLRRRLSLCAVLPARLRFFPYLTKRSVVSIWCQHPLDNYFAFRYHTIHILLKE